MGFDTSAQLNRSRAMSTGIDPIMGSYRGYRSQCKKCEHALLVGEKSIWLTGPIIGLAHERCPG